MLQRVDVGFRLHLTADAGPPSDLCGCLGTGFSKDPTKDFELEPNDTGYILVDNPDLGRIYLEVKAESKAHF